MLLDHLRNDLPFDVIEQKFPICYTNPMHSSIHKEASSYKRMINVMQSSLLELIANFEGHHPNPYEVEALWNSVSQNCIPERWLLVSFATAHLSISAFLIELEMKLDFWNKLATKDSLD